jgi:hypothetical protein
MTKCEQLKLAVSVFKQMTDSSLNHAAVSGALSNTSSNAELVQRLIDAELTLSQPLPLPHDNAAITISFDVPRDREAFFANNFDELLKREYALKSPPACFYIADEDASYFGDNFTPNPSIENYFSAAAVAKMLTSIADHQDSSHGDLRLIFLQKEKLEIIIKCEKSDLAEIKKVKELSDLFEENIKHKEQRISIFKKLLLEDLKGITPDKRFAQILSSLDNLFVRFHDNYQLYLSDFSVEKVLEEVHEQKVELIGKFHKTFSEIQNHLLTIPLAVLLIAGQMQDTTSISLKNISILIGSIVFAFIMNLLLKNQTDNLQAIKQEIDHQQTQFNEKHSALSSKYSDLFNDLTERYNKQKKLLKFVDGMVALLLILSFALFIVFSGWIDF